MPSTDECLQSVKDSLINNVSVLEMLDHYPLEECRRHSRVPHTFGINDYNRSLRAHAEARRLTAFNPLGPEKEIFTLQELREK